VSLTHGIKEVAESVFQGLPVHIAHANSVSGPTSAFENPQLSTCIGVAKYAQAVQSEMPPGNLLTEFFSKIKRSFHIA
jgi:cell division ATPase FtsA